MHDSASYFRQTRTKIWGWMVQKLCVNLIKNELYSTTLIYFNTMLDFWSSKKKLLDLYRYIFVHLILHLRICWSYRKKSLEAYLFWWQIDSALKFYSFCISHSRIKKFLMQANLFWHAGSFCKLSSLIFNFLRFQNCEKDFQACLC